MVEKKTAPQERGAEDRQKTIEHITKVVNADFSDRETPFTISFQKEGYKGRHARAFGENWEK